jgi:hypothetical protein
MKATIRDAEALGSIRPLEFAAYLRAAGWQQVVSEEGRYAIWQCEGAPEDLLLPLDRNFRDYPNRIGEALQLLERTEQRSELEILSDLSTASADVLRVRLHEGDVVSGSVPMDDGVHLFESSRELLMAGALATVEPRSLYGPRRPAQALDYIRAARFGQTEWGSYVVTVISRVSPELRAVQPEIFNGVIDEPFERKVMETLAKALVATNTAARTAAVDGGLQSFTSRVRDGVSANLCEAIVGMAGGVDTRRALSFDFSWARTRPMRDRGVPTSITLDADVIPVIAEAGRVFRETAPRDDFHATGPVVRLDRPEGAPSGRVTVIGFVDDHARRISFDLGLADYELAVTAHREERPVNCVGTLVREGRMFILRNPHDFTVAPEEE